jgi:hypothetical protein
VRSIPKPAPGIGHYSQLNLIETAIDSIDFRDIEERHNIECRWRN